MIVALFGWPFAGANILMHGDHPRHAIQCVEFMKQESKGNARGCSGLREFDFSKFMPRQGGRPDLNPKGAFLDDRMPKIAIQIASARKRFLLARRPKIEAKPDALMQESRSYLSPHVLSDLARYLSCRYERSLAFSCSVLNPSDEETPETR